MNLVPESINEAIKHLTPRSPEEIEKAMAGAAVDERFTKGCELGNLSLVKSSIEQVDLSSVLNQRWFNPIITAKRNKHYEIVEFILNNVRFKKYFNNLSLQDRLEKSYEWGVFDEFKTTLQKIKNEGEDIGDDLIYTMSRFKYNSFQNSDILLDDERKMILYVVDNYINLVPEKYKSRFLNVINQKPYKLYPVGYKQMRVLDILDKAGKKGLKQEDMRKLAYELSYGKGAYDRVNNAGYWSDAFGNWRRNLMDEYDVKEISKTGRNVTATYFVLNEKGKKVLERLKKKFIDSSKEEY